MKKDTVPRTPAEAILKFVNETVDNMSLEDMKRSIKKHDGVFHAVECSGCRKDLGEAIVYSLQDVKVKFWCERCSK